MLHALPKGKDFEGFVNFLKLLASPRAFFIHLNFNTQKSPVQQIMQQMIKLRLHVLSADRAIAGNTACIG